MPQISVITVCYNDARFLAEQFASVQASTLTDYQHVVVDNGSTDDSLARMDAYAAGDDRVTVVTVERNHNYANGLNVGVRNALAPWVLKMDADDRIRPTYLERIVAVTREQPSVNCIFSPAYCFGHIAKAYTYHYPPFNPATMCDQLQIPGPSAWPRWLWDAIGGMDERIEAGEDWDFAVRAQRAIGLTPYQFETALFEYRQHSVERLHDVGMRNIAWLKAHMKAHTVESAVIGREVAA